MAEIQTMVTTLADLRVEVYRLTKIGPCLGQLDLATLLHHGGNPVNRHRNTVMFSLASDRSCMSMKLDFSNTSLSYPSLHDHLLKGVMMDELGLNLSFQERNGKEYMLLFPSVLKPMFWSTNLAIPMIVSHADVYIFGEYRPVGTLTEESWQSITQCMESYSGSLSWALILVGNYGGPVAVIGSGRVRDCRAGLAGPE